MNHSLNCSALLVGLILALLTPVHPVHAGDEKGPFPGIPQLKGFAKSVAGEQLDYYCFNPLATSALLTRCTTGEMAIEWETEVVPMNLASDHVCFTWIVSYSTMTSAGDRTFDLHINGQKSFVIKTSRGVNVPAWTLQGDGGSALAFRLVHEDRARDANGYMYLKVPVSALMKGAPLRIRIVGEKANSSDWFMTFAYDLRTIAIEVLPLPFLVAEGKQLRQTVSVAVASLAEKGRAAVSIDDGVVERRALVRGSNIFDLSIPAVREPREVRVRVAVDGQRPETLRATVAPVKKRTIYLLPHSHNDIGYTDLQSEVLKKQVRNIYDALSLIRKTAHYPPEARFKWNCEVLWGVEEFMKKASEADRDAFLDAVRSGSMCVEGLYANVLTGIMRPEEFYRLTGYARTLREKYGIRATSAMISDIPGVTWNMVPALAQAGIRYFSSGPNGTYMGGDRTGHTNRAWADRPFYWVSPSGNERLLYWTTGFGYGSFFAGISSPGANRLAYRRDLRKYFAWLDEISYPYDMIQMRHTVNGDNGTVDPELPDMVKDWNEHHISPKIVVATTEGFFGEFERRYGDVLPAFRGDITPYWEDGAASTAYELGLNRRTSEGLVQTEALAAILAPSRYDPEAFTEAWKNVLLFDEHTWGAHNSITDPDSSFAVQQLEIKKQFALDAVDAAAALRASVMRPAAAGTTPGMFDVVNTASWVRTDLVTLPAALSSTGDVVRDDSGSIVPSQRLVTGDLAFLATHVPGLGARRYTLHTGVSTYRSALRIGGLACRDNDLEVVLDSVTGSILRLRTFTPSAEYADTMQGCGLNGYFYVAGLDAREATTSGRTSIAIQEHGPLVASFRVTSEAPGCNVLQREVRVISGLGRVDIVNTIDKKKVRAKEGVHFGFPFRIPDAIVRVDLGLGVIRPEADQLAGSCKDFLSAQRWVDVSNQDRGVTLTVSEAPLVEVGEMHSELPSPRNVAWRTTRWSSPRVASYVMNNYWHTNYAAEQSGVSTYHYSIIPHGSFNQQEVTRNGIERSQPLVVRAVTAGERKPDPLLSVSPAGVLVTSIKPLAPGGGYLVRLFNASGSCVTAHLRCRESELSVYRSSAVEEKGERIDAIALPPDGSATVRVE